MTDRELMQQALDALEEYTNVVTSVNDPNSWVTVADGGRPAREAITALRERLAQPEQGHTGFMDSKINPIQRPWVGLTEPERLACYDLNPARFASAIENSLKEKNT